MSVLQEMPISTATRHGWRGRRVFAAHEILFSTPETFGEFGLVVADESFWQAGLAGINPGIGVEIASLDVSLRKYPVRERSGLRRSHAAPARDDRMPARRAQTRA